MLCTVLLFSFAVNCIDGVSALALPDYIKPCSRSDPNLNECALQSAKTALHQYVLGDPSRNLKPLDPLFVPEMIVFVPNEQGLKLVFKDNIFNGFSTMQIINFKFDLDKKLIYVDAFVTLSVESKYDLTGKILVVPVESNGDASIKLKNTTLHLKLWYEHQPSSDGTIFWVITKNDLKYEVGKAIFQLDNLLNNKNIGDQINKLLNELWREIITDVGPAIATSLCAAVVDNVSVLLAQVPYDEILPP